MDKNMQLKINYQSKMIYEEVLKKFYEAMRNINIIEDEELFNYLKLEFDKIVNLIKQFKEGLIYTQVIKLLYDISFKDLVKDKYILEAVSCNKTDLSSDLFISTIDKESSDNERLFRIKDDNGQLKIVRYCPGNVSERDLEISDLSSLVSLERAIQKSDYIGYRANTFYIAEILYSGMIDNSKYFTLYTIDGEDGFQVCVSEKSYLNNGLFNNIQFDEQIHPCVELGDRKTVLNTGNPDYDKMLILKVIQEQVKTKYDDVYKKVR